MKKVKVSPSQKIAKSENIPSHQKGKKGKPLKKQDSDDSDEDEDKDSNEMNDFIAPDEEVHEEQRVEADRKRKKRAQRRNERAKKQEDDSDDLKNKQKKRRIEKEKDELDSDDYELLREAKGGKTGRLRKVADEKLKKEETKMIIDTGDRRRMEMPEDIEMTSGKQRLEKAQKIFGEKYQERSRIDQSALEEPFNADEIDDPYTTNLDKKMVARDVPERLQIRLGDRLDNIVESELQEEAQWILDKLACLSGEKGQKYSALVGQQDVIRKIYKVLKLFRSEHLDVPMITRYRKYEYAEELDEDAVWYIYQFDQEFGKFVKQKKKIADVLEKVIKYNPQMELHKSLLGYAKSQSELNNFTYLVRFLQSYYSDELALEDQSEERKNQKKQPIKRDDVKIARASKLDEFASRCLLPWAQYYENLQLRKIAYRPNEPSLLPTNFAEEYLCDAFNDKVKVFEGVVKLAAQELSAQPIIRNMIKKDLRENGYLSTAPTEQGKKDLDVFHPSYRVKNINQRLLSDLQGSEVFLDIAQCEADGLITVQICRNEQQQQNFKNFLEELYMPATNEGNQWNILRSEVIKTLLERLNSKELEKEVRDELRDEAEQVVILKCQKVYKELLLTGPYTTQDTSNEEGMNEAFPQNRKKGGQDELIKDRERLNVLGAFMQQIDMHTYVTTVAIVDKFGELVAHKDFMHLLPPRKRRTEQQQEGEEVPRAPPVATDEEREHEKDKEKLKELLSTYSVDLIVVAANSLDARNLKRSLDAIAAEAKIGQQKEAFVIWGSPEVPKLFAQSHNSQKLHKNTPSILKQAISLCRFEQDPLAEVLNLWSPITAENQALALNLDPLQKFVNQVKLADVLEEVNIQAVNDIGVDLNLVVDHDHMHSLLQFISGLGPRKAKNLIDRIKQLGSKLITRSQIYKEKLLARSVYISASAFLKIKLPAEERIDNQPFDVLDQTRIHHESYKLALQIADDACHTDTTQNKEEEDRLRQHRRVKEVIQNPDRLKNLDIKLYFQQLAASGRSNMKILIDMTIKELTAPFSDPRVLRNPEKVNIPNEKLLYLLIDESERSFRKGMIVTATVQKVFENKAVCRLENGLAAIILEQDIVEMQDDKINQKLDFGHIITGRIKSIDCEHDKPFEVKLQCKQKDLQSHEEYVEFLTGLKKSEIPVDDLRNQNFSVDTKPKQLGRFQARRIAFEKFKNVSSRRAALELHESEVGDFIFRPSTRSENAITLTWKFWRKHLVHIDIQEQEKIQGAAIGSKLMISSDSFDNLREIVERYIIPCNRLLREVTNHQKFTDADNFDELAERVMAEKKEDPTKIPYRFGILSSYPQHVVLAYVPKEKVVKEFIRVKPRGFFFHDQTLSPFQALINWFKDNWRNRDYQRNLRRQKSPRLATRVIQPQPTGQKQEPGQDWGNAGGTSSHNQDFPMKTERRNVKTEGHKSPHHGQTNSGWETNAGEDNQNNWGGGGGGDEQPSRGRGRGGGGGGGRACFKCNEEGHMARECPNEDQRGGAGRGRGGGGGGGRPCYKCNEEGHMARDCPTGGGGAGGGGNRACFKCGEEGHMSRECPQGGGGGGGGGNRACFKCGEEGHMSRECPTGGGGGGRGPVKCFKCNEEGHMSRECPQGGGGGDRGPIKCFKCNEEGHMSRECPQGGGGGGGNRACFKCGEEGHMSRECPQGGGGGKGGSPYKRQRTDNGNNDTSADAGGGGGWGTSKPDGGDNAWGASGDTAANNGGEAGGGWGSTDKPAENSGGW